MVSTAITSVGSVLLMPMKLNPFSNPQLDDLPETVSRQEVLASAKRRKPFSFLLPYGVLVLLGFLLIKFVIWLNLGFGVGELIRTGCLAIFFLAIIYLIRAENQKFIRSIMRQYYQVPICVRCGYQAASMETQTCPECGKAVEGSLRAK